MSSKTESKNVILIFAKHLDGVADIAQAFVAQGFHVFTETTSYNFFARIKICKPTKVLISLSVETRLQSYLFTYIRNRHQVPVFTFHEKNGNGHKPDSRDSIYISSKNSQEISKEVLGSLNISNMPKALPKDQSGKKDNLDLQGLSDSAERASGPELPSEMYVFFEAIHSRLEKAVQFFGAENFDLFSVKVIAESGRCQLSILIPHEFSPETRKITSQQIISELESAFEVKPEIEIYETKVSKAHVDRMRSLYDFPLVGRLNNIEMGLFTKALPEKDLLTFDWDETANLFFVPVESWLVGGALDFHMYIWMPVNQHRVLYVRRGQPLGIDQFARLKTQGLGEVGILPADVKIYQQRRQALHLAPEA
jgi:hypothetical protein